ncbi:hypothetical protein PL373_14680 [Tenacibaculum maritimum]|nr:hypothetical protein [Tenacibaculum maritimum]MDB0602364.1 hypothetical protein [Tenacibaculum maritimum]MDB0613475.1 hypothetical protein [Tenacibaculum maritimum]
MSVSVVSDDFMFILIIKKNRSKNFSKAIECALTLGGSFDGEEIRIEIDDVLHIYDKIFPILKYNVTNWTGTKAFFNGLEVHPYRFMLQKHLSINIALAEFSNQLDPKPSISKYYTYYKRENNNFFFKNEDFHFDVELRGKELYEFLEEYEFGDVLHFPNMSSLFL